MKKDVKVDDSAIPDVIDERGQSAGCFGEHCSCHPKETEEEAEPSKPVERLE